MQPSIAVLAAACALSALRAQEPTTPGYTDTPMLPGSAFCVHDSRRPHPPVVTPGALVGPVAAPEDAVILFDGMNLDAWTGNGGKASWSLEDGAMVVNGTGDIRTKAGFGDCQLHLEWASPSEVKGDSQGRGNSGVFFFERYEVQILDSFDNVTYADGQAAALYGQRPPMVNCCRKPGEWQTYDIVFQAPRFGADGALRSPARVTVLHNGILVHHDQPLLGATSHRGLARYSKHEEKGPIKLQDHGNPVRFRNVWIRELDLVPAVDEPKDDKAAAVSGQGLDAAIAALMAKDEQPDESIVVQHILIGFRGAPRLQGVTRSKDEAKALCEKLYAEILGGADFDALMKANSNDSGPGTYPMTKQGRRQMVQAFGDVGFRLKVGEVGVAPHDASKSPFGWHIIKRLK